MSKRKTGRRLVSLLLAVLMLIAYMPLLGEAAYAEGIEYPNCSDGMVVGDHPNNYGPVISSNKTEYELGEDIYIKVENSGSATSGGWIGIYDSYGANPNTTSRVWAYTGNKTVNDVTDYVIYGPNKNAGVTVNSELTGGTYYIIHMADDGRWAVLPISIKVEPSTFSLNKRVFTTDEPVMVSAISGYPDAWVGLYPYYGGDPLDNGDLMTKYKVADAEGEAVDILHGDIVENKESVEGMTPGRYKAILFDDGGWSIDQSRAGGCIEAFYVYDPDTLFTWYEDEEDGETKAYATFIGSGPIEVDAVITSETTDATCSEAGKTVYTATVDADAIDGAISGSLASNLKTAAPFTDTKTVEIPKKPHTPGEAVQENVVAPECGKAGSHDEVVYCTVCEEELSRESKVDAALEHDYQEVADSAKAATCTEAGKEADKKCSLCGDVVTGAEIPALGHNMTAHEAKEATREAEGNSAYWSCDRCGKFFSDAEGKAEITEGSWVLPKQEPTEEEKAAKEELNKAVDEAKKVEQGNYTDESFKALQDAIAEAEALAKDVNATKEQLDAAAAKIADAKAALKDKEPEVGTEVVYSSNTYAVTSEPGAAEKTVAFTKAKNSKSVTVPSTMKINGETYKVTSVAAKAFKGSKCTTAYIGANVKKLDKYAFRYSKVKTVYIKSKSLSKSRVKGSLKYSKVTTVKAKVSTKKSTNKKYAKKFKSYFTKANAGKKVTVKY